jgi:hypothetical protein
VGFYVDLWIMWIFILGVRGYLILGGEVDKTIQMKWWIRYVIMEESDEGAQIFVL